MATLRSWANSSSLFFSVSAFSWLSGQKGFYHHKHKGLKLAMTGFTQLPPIHTSTLRNWVLERLSYTVYSQFMNTPQIYWISRPNFKICYPISQIAFVIILPNIYGKKHMQLWISLSNDIFQVNYKKRVNYIYKQGNSLKIWRNNI